MDVFVNEHVLSYQNPNNEVEIKRAFQQFKKFRPHMIVLALNEALGNEVLGEASKVNFTTPHGWLWLVMDFIATWSPEEDVISGKSLILKGEHLLFLIRR